MNDRDDEKEPADCCSRLCVHRRSVLLGMAGMAASVAGGGVFAQEANTLPPQPGDYIVRASGDDLTPLTPADIEVGGQPIQAWPADPATGEPRSRTLYNLLIVSRWDPAEMTADAQANAAEGVVANTVICTHAACEVTDWVEEFRIMECPCHFSRFDLRANGAVIQGPAARKLPSLGLALEGDKLIVARAFDSRVGGDTE